MNAVLFCVSAGVLVGCSHRGLVPDESGFVAVPVTLDWSRSGMTPNGASTLAFNESGDIYKHFSPSADPNSFVISLPKGKYNLLFFNDSPLELGDGMGFRNEDRLADCEVFYDEMKFRHAPDSLSIGRVEDFVVDGSGEGVVATPQRVTRKLVVDLTLENIGSSKSRILAWACNFSTSCSLWEEEYKGSGSYPFEIYIPTSAISLENKGMVRGEVTTFGPICDYKELSQYKGPYVILNYELLNGQKCQSEFYLKDCLEERIDKNGVPYLYASLEDKLPVVHHDSYAPGIPGWDDGNDESIIL